ncbi:MAG TPA: hypothetical protein VKV95_18835 [Terriglobia bacterium]|nr:hypothetical protein [Terriglobia bacterium]
MKTQLSTEDGEMVRSLARAAVDGNIQLMECTSSIAEILGCSYEFAYEWVNAMSITLDSGTEVTESDFGELWAAAS